MKQNNNEWWSEDTGQSLVTTLRQVSWINMNETRFIINKCKTLFHENIFIPSFAVCIWNALWEIYFDDEKEDKDEKPKKKIWGMTTEGEINRRNK